jgi:hypothetical protein
LRTPATTEVTVAEAAETPEAPGAPGAQEFSQTPVEEYTDASGGHLSDITFTDEQCDRFIDRFIHEYFTALGLAYLSPYDDVMTAEVDVDEVFVGDIAEAETEPPLD